jgi:hypothetical protein
VLLEAPLSPLSSRLEESWAFGPPKAMKIGSCSATTVGGSAALPFVISTGAQRSGEICGVSGPSLGMFFDRAQRSGGTCGFSSLLLGDSCSAATVAGSAALPFVISTGAQRSGEICVFSGPSLEMFFLGCLNDGLIPATSRAPPYQKARRSPACQKKQRYRRPTISPRG